MCWGTLCILLNCLKKHVGLCSTCLTKVVEYGGSDLFITADFPPSIKHQGLMKPFGQQEFDI